MYDLGSGFEATTGILETYRQEHFVIKELERHLTGPEIFIPVEGVSMMPFAPAGKTGKPDVDEIEVFIIDGTQGLVIEKGVWHFPPLPLTPVMRFVLTVPKNVGDDLDIQSFEELRIEL
jgi:ureidoglycolate lyase